jgi:hypothetical protein
MVDFQYGVQYCTVHLYVESTTVPVRSTRSYSVPVHTFCMMDGTERTESAASMKELEDAHHATLCPIAVVDARHC